MSREKLCVLYMRYSSDNQTEQSIEGQNSECEEYCKRHGFIIIHKYIDRATSAYKSINKRVEFLKMIEDSYRKNFQYVVVWSLDRFSRKTSESEKYREELKKNGVELISVTEPISSEPAGIITRGMFTAFAEYYSAELSRKVQRGMHESAKKCQFLGSKPPFGYKVVDKKYEIDEREAPYVLEVFKMYDIGRTKKEIIEYLNAHGLKTKRGGEHNTNSVDRILKTEMYTGTYIRAGIVVPDGVPQIVPKDLFYRVKEKLTKRTANKYCTPNDYLLAGKLYCGKCGRRMYAYSGTSKTGKQYLYYKCEGYKKNKKGDLCSQLPISKSWIENIATLSATELFNTLDFRAIAKQIYENIQTSARANSEKELRSSLAADKKKAGYLAHQIAETCSDALLGELQAIETRIKENEIKLEALDAFRITEDDIYEFLIDFTSNNYMDDENRRMITDSFIAAMTIDTSDEGTHTINIFYSVLSTKLRRAITITDEITREDPDGREEVFENLPVWLDEVKDKNHKAPKTKGSEASEKEFEIQKDGGAYETNLEPHKILLERDFIQPIGYNLEPLKYKEVVTLSGYTIRQTLLVKST